MPTLAKIDKNRAKIAFFSLSLSILAKVGKYVFFGAKKRLHYLNYGSQTVFVASTHTSHIKICYDTSFDQHDDRRWDGARRPEAKDGVASPNI